MRLLRPTVTLPGSQRLLILHFGSGPILLHLYRKIAIIEMKEPTVYILANSTNRVLYTGVTSNLIARVFEHRQGYSVDSFTARYRVFRLVYYERHERMEDAIQREKQIKGGSRRKKITLIESINPFWRDLYENIT